jgi:hypothetical protein
MKKPNQKIALDRREDPLEQYDFIDDEIIYRQKDKYAQSIGTFILTFSGLENALDRLIIESVSPRSNDLGFRIVRYLEFIDKIKLAKDQYEEGVRFLNDKKKRGKNERLLKIITQKLIEISEFRNKVAHANWMTLDKSGFVRVDNKENKDSGGIVFKMVKMTPSVICKFTRQADAVESLIEKFQESLNEDFNWGERKLYNKKKR